MQKQFKSAALIVLLLLVGLTSALFAVRRTPAGSAAQPISGSYQTTAGVVTIDVEGAEFMGGNTSHDLLFGFGARYDFIASPDHQLTIRASAPSNPFGSDASGVYNELTLTVDGTKYMVNGTDTQLTVQGTIDLAHPSDSQPTQWIGVNYGTPQYSSSQDLRSLYPDYCFGANIGVYVFEIPIITLTANVTSITLPYNPSSGQNPSADVQMDGQVLPPGSSTMWQIYANGEQAYPDQQISVDSNGVFNFTETYDAVDQLILYGNDSVTFTYTANYTTTAIDMANSEFVTPSMLASSATVSVAVAVSIGGSLPPPQENNASRLPVIFIPGVGGTELDIQSGGETNPLWPIPGGPSRWQVVRHFWQLGTKTDMSALNLTSDGVSSADPNISVSPGDILRTSPADFYGGMISYLQSIGYVEGQSLFVFPYDWRLDNAAHLNDLDNLVDRAMSINASQKVVLLAHSMGGLIAAAYVNSEPTRAAKVDSIITMGTPFWGSPKCYYGLTEGYALGNRFADVQQIKSMEGNWPAVYELLPKSYFISIFADLLSPSDSFNITYRDAYTGAPTKLNTQLLDVANSFNSLLGTPNTPVLAAGVKLYTIIGFGTQTLSGYYARKPTGYEYQRNMTVTFNDEEVVLVPKFGDGDGTVPLWGAENDAATAKYYVKTSSSSLFGDSASHGDLPSNPKVQSIVASILNSTPTSPDEYPYTGGLNQFEKMDLTIHSDANLEVFDGNGGMMGWTGYNGSIVEDLAQGAFLDQDGIQYASIQNASTPYFIFVNGTQTGEFTMTVNITMRGGSTAFEYDNVTVVNGTVAQLSLDPNVDNVPQLSVTTDGNFTLVSATIISRTGGPTTWLPVLFEVSLAVVAIVAAVMFIKLRKHPELPRENELPPPPDDWTG